MGWCRETVLHGSRKSCLHSCYLNTCAVKLNEVCQRWPTAGFQSVLGGQPKMETRSSDWVFFIIDVDLVFGSTHIQSDKIWWLPQGTEWQYVQCWPSSVVLCKSIEWNPPIEGKDCKYHPIKRWYVLWATQLAAYNFLITDFESYIKQQVKTCKNTNSW